MAAKIACDVTSETLTDCRSEDRFSLIWEKAKQTLENISEVMPAQTNVKVKTSKREKKLSYMWRLQALIGETTCTAEPIPPITFTDEERGRVEVYYAALDRVLTVMGERFASRDMENPNIPGRCCAWQSIGGKL